MSPSVEGNPSKELTTQDDKITKLTQREEPQLENYPDTRPSSRMALSSDVVVEMEEGKRKMSTFSSSSVRKDDAKSSRPSSVAANWIHVKSIAANNNDEGSSSPMKSQHSGYKSLESPVTPNTVPSLGRRITTGLKGVEVDELINSPTGADKRPTLEKLAVQISDNNTLSDQFGRSLWLRGVNMCAKIPRGLAMKCDQADTDLFYDHNNVSFVDEPISLDSCDEHFTRLKIWGLSFIRLGVPWEALEHEGPGIYDEDYIEFLIKLIAKAGEHGFKVIIDPHQDVWSRFSGGSGAPGWTFDTVGLDIKTFRKTAAAHIHSWNQEDPTSQQMLWPTNLTKLACQTMFTLFFAGNVFAPKTKARNQDGSLTEESVQDYLQRHYIQCYAYLAGRISHLDAVLSFEVMNEPHHGYVGLKSFDKYNYDKMLHLSLAPSALQGMALGEGYSQIVDVYERSFPWPTRKVGKKLVNEEGIKVWKYDGCIWKAHGLWDTVEENGKTVPRILTPDYFLKNPQTGASVEFNKDFYLPFIKRYISAVRTSFGGRRNLLFLVEPIPNESPPRVSTSRDCEELGLQRDLIYAPHWYDLSLLFSKKFNSLFSHDVQELSNGSRNFFKNTYIGTEGMRNNYKKQIHRIVRAGYTSFNLPQDISTPRMKSVPIIFGECGIPMDMNDHIGYSDSDYEYHNLALDAMLRALESTGVCGFTLWNYYPKNEVMVGDHWNGEDFSIFSKTIADGEVGHKALAIEEDEDTIDFSKWFVGGRALEAIIRPYAAKVAGEVQRAEFDFKTGTYILQFTTPPLSNSDSIPPGPSLKRQTEIYVPAFQYMDKNDKKDPYHYLDIDVSDGEFLFDPASQTMFYWHNPRECAHSVVLQRKSGLDHAKLAAKKLKVKKKVGVQPVKYSWNFIVPLAIVVVAVIVLAITFPVLAF
ncbi:hypothetical protein MP638_001821 [Amoeboaphelidium occidentale]|nr:hypothetical protein MP638_001821 [Amoeboaphelidium occidentale]